MLYDIPINITVEASTEEEAEIQLWNFLKYSKNHCGKEYGFVDWEVFEFLPIESYEYEIDPYE